MDTKTDSRNEARAVVRSASAFILTAALLGACAGLVRGFGVVTQNGYREHLPRLARWVPVEAAASAMLQTIAAAVICLIAILLAWPVARVILRGWRRAFRGAVLAVPVVAAYLVLAWWVNRTYLPGFLSAGAIVANVLMAIAAAALWYGLVRLSDGWRFARIAAAASWLTRPIPLAVLSLLVAGPLTAREFMRPDAPADKPDVLLIVLDALRRDRLGAYGHSRDTSPHLDRFAKESSLYLDAISTAPWTKPAVASMFTGLYPRGHGVASAEWNVQEGAGVAQLSVLPRSLLTLAEVMADAGYRTGAFGQNHHLVARLGFDQGFEVHELELTDRGTVEKLAHRLKLGIGRRDAARERNTARNIDQHFLDWMPGSDERFFSYVHHIDIHWPYRAPEPHAGYYGPRRSNVDFNSQDFYAKFGPDREATGATPAIDAATLEDMSNAYDEGIRHVDAELGKLFEELKRRGRYDKTLIIVTADHGEQFMEHGEIGHGTSLHDVLLRVPLIVKYPCPGPHCGPRRVAEPVQLIDLMPTILETAGIEVPKVAAGRSLTDPLQPERTLFAEKGDQVALRTQQYKFIYNLDGSGAELYALQSDPGEKVNLAETEPALAQTFRDRLFQWIEETDSTATAPHEQVPADDAMLEKLKSLGYLK